MAEIVDELSPSPESDETALDEERRLLDNLGEFLILDRPCGFIGWDICIGPEETLVENGEQLDQFIREGGGTPLLFSQCEAFAWSLLKRDFQWLRDWAVITNRAIFEHALERIELSKARPVDRIAKLQEIRERMQDDVDRERIDLRIRCIQVGRMSSRRSLGLFEGALTRISDNNDVLRARIAKLTEMRDSEEWGHERRMLDYFIWKLEYWIQVNDELDDVQSMI